MWSVPDGVPSLGGAAKAVGNGLVKDCADEADEGHVEHDTQEGDDPAHLSHHPLLDHVPAFALARSLGTGSDLAIGLAIGLACTKSSVSALPVNWPRLTGSKPVASARLDGIVCGRAGAHVQLTDDGQWGYFELA